MRVDLGALRDRDTLLKAAGHFEEFGFLILDGVGDAITQHFKPIVADRMKVPLAELERLLDPDSKPVTLPVEIRERLSRISSPADLQARLLAVLEPLFVGLLGPFVQVSSTFHGQLKGGDARPVDHGGYDPKAQYLEVQGQYLIHQDFTGASLPTSPCAVTLWTPLNSCPDWNLRLYPGSHRHGLLIHDWLPLDDEWLTRFGEPLDLAAETGTAIVFNSLVLHSSSRPGPRRRVSCDIRFFPLCAFLPSEVHVLGSDPLGALRQGLARPQGPTLRAPLLEAAAFLGTRDGLEPCPPHSILNWANFVHLLATGRPEEAKAHLVRFVNQEFGKNGPEIYLGKFHDKPIHRAPLAGLHRQLAALAPDAPEVTALAARLASPVTVAS